MTVVRCAMIHDFVLLNALRNLPEVEAAIQQPNDGIRSSTHAFNRHPMTVGCGGVRLADT